MSRVLNITQSDREILRKLADKVAGYANLPVMDERKRLWQAHNELHGDRPVVVVEMDGFVNDLLPPLRCQGEAARDIELQLEFYIVNHEMVDDDKIVPSGFPVHWQINDKQLGLDLHVERAESRQGRDIGYRIKHPINNLKADLHMLRPSEYSVDRDGTMAWKAFVDGVIGDILPTKITNSSLTIDSVRTTAISPPMMV